MAEISELQLTVDYGDMHQVAEIVERAMAGASPAQFRRMTEDWNEMERHGARMCDTFCNGDTLVCLVSDDFRQHLRKYGVKVPSAPAI